MPFAEKIRDIQDLLEKEKYDTVVAECGSIMEDALRRAINDVLQDGAPQVCRPIFDVMDKINKGNSRKPLNLNLGELVGVYQNSNLVEALSKKYTSNFKLSRSIDWKLFVEWRNKAIHHRSPTTELEATQMLIWLRVFLYDCELAGEPKTVLAIKRKIKVPKYCDSCNQKTKSNWNFCPFCGKAFLPVCKSCRRPLESSWKICPYCEHPVNMSRSISPNSISEYTCACNGAWMDGIINPCERRILDKMRIRLGIPLDVAQEIEKSCAPQTSLQYYCCVEAVAIDGVITYKERRFLESKIHELNIDPWVAKEIEASVMTKYQSSATCPATPE